MRLLPDSQTRQPLYPARLDRGNRGGGLGVGLIEAYNAGAGWRSASGGQPLSIPSSARRIVTRGGGVMTQLNGSSSINGTLARFPTGDAERSLLVVCRTAASNNAFDVIVSVDHQSSQLPSLRLQIDSTGGGFQAWDGGGPEAVLAGSLAPSTDYVLLAVESYGALVLYVGSAAGIYTATRLSGSTNASLADRIYIGGYAGQDGAWFKGAVGLVLAWSRALTDTEARAVIGNPWQAYTPPARNFWIGGLSASTPAVLVGAAGAQTNLAGSAAVGQRHQVAAAGTSQSAAAGNGAIAQHHALTAAAASQANVATTGAAAQAGRVVGAPGSQANAAGAGAITQRHALIGAAATQAQTAAGAAVAQHHALTGAAGAQENIGATGAAFGSTSLAGAPASQSNDGTAAAIGQRHSLLAAPSVQDAIAGASAVVQRHVAAAEPGLQVNLGAVGALLPPASASVAAIWAYRPDGVTSAADMLLQLRAQVNDLYRVHGLMLGQPLEVATDLTWRRTGSILQTITEAGGVSTMERQS